MQLGCMGRIWSLLAGGAGRMTQGMQGSLPVYKGGSTYQQVRGHFVSWCPVPAATSRSSCRDFAQLPEKDSRDPIVGTIG